MQFPKVADRNNIQSLRQCGLGTRSLRNIETIEAKPPRTLGGRQSPGTGPKITAKRQFPINPGPIKSEKGQLFACGENANRERCIEARSAFPKAGWREVDDNPSHRELKATVLNCSAHTLSRLADSSIAKANDLKGREPLPDVHLDRNRNRSEALKSECDDAGEHSPIPR
jgi:hypothetical protein